MQLSQPFGGFTEADERCILQLAQPYNVSFAVYGLAELQWNVCRDKQNSTAEFQWAKCMKSTHSVKRTVLYVKAHNIS